MYGRHDEENKKMSCVTQRIKEIKQPRGGYVRPSRLKIRRFDDGCDLAEAAENVSPGLVGSAVDYLTRFAMGASLSEAFAISLTGAKVAQVLYKRKGTVKKATKLLSGIKAINKKAIVNACKLATYDVWARRPSPMAALYKGPDDIKPDEATTENIAIMVERNLRFWEAYGPIVKDGFTFEPNGYTMTVDSGDGDYLTRDTLWDLKTNRSRPTSRHTLQLLMYWIMGQHSGQKIYRKISKIGIFNPRLNEVYTLDVKAISKKIIREVEKNVICYD